jgi:hypothetical protein
LRVGTLPFEFDLVYLQAGIDWNQAFLSPIQVLTGETIVFEVNCAVIGQQGGTGCNPTATIIGRLVDI